MNINDLFICHILNSKYILFKVNSPIQFIKDGLVAVYEGTENTLDFQIRMGALSIAGEIAVETHRKLNNLSLNGTDISNYARGDII